MHHAFSFGRPQHWIDESILDAPGPYEPTAARAPLYPLIIAALWSGDAPPRREVWLAQALLGMLVALMVYVIALKAFGFGAALVAGLAVALGPLTALMTALFLSETLFTFLFTASLWFWTRKNGAMAGIMLGAATLTRAVSLPLVGVVLLLGLLMKSNRAFHLKVASVALATIAPWTIRNALTQHAFIPVASVGWGANMLLGTIDVPYGTGPVSMAYAKDKGFWDIATTAETPQAAEKLMGAPAIERIRQAPPRLALVARQGDAALLARQRRLYFDAPRLQVYLPSRRGRLLGVGSSGDGPGATALERTVSACLATGAAGVGSFDGVDGRALQPGARADGGHFRRPRRDGPGRAAIEVPAYLPLNSPGAIPVQGYRGNRPFPTFAFTPKIKRVRPHFTANEFRMLRAALRKWIEATQNPAWKKSRQLPLD